MRRRTTRGPGSSWVLVAAITLIAVIAGPASIAGAEPTKEPVTVRTASKRTWTNTGVRVKTGESITIDASGTIHFGPFPIDAVGPAGKPPASCTELAVREGPFTAPDLNCWSLIGKIGADAPFQVGSHTSFSATSDGELLLGVNDNRRQDNLGSWRATISVAAASSGGGGPAPSGGSSKSNVLLFVLIGLAILLALFALFFLARRRGNKRPVVVVAPADHPHEVLFAHVAPPPPVTVPAEVILEEHVEQPIEESVASLAKAPGPLGTSVAPVEGEIVEVNIFEVELANGTDLRVGYNYFPEDTDLHWQVRQGSLFAHGQFPTDGGGNMYHYVTLPLGVRLEPAVAVDVQFSWSIMGVPFRYSVRRDPGL